MNEAKRVQVTGGPWHGLTGEVAEIKGRFLVIQADARSIRKFAIVISAGLARVTVHEGQTREISPGELEELEAKDQVRAQAAVVEADRQAWPDGTVSLGKAAKLQDVLEPILGADMAQRLVGRAVAMGLPEGVEGFRPDCDPLGACASHGRCWTHSQWADLAAPGRKDDQEKTRWDLVPVLAEAEVAEVLTHGAAKYGAENWRQVPEPFRRYYAAHRRHMEARRRGELVDPDSGRHHVALAISSLLFILQLDLEGQSEAPAERSQLELEEIVRPPA